MAAIRTIFALAAAAFCASAYSADFSRMYVFGDSLSDVGNVNNSQEFNDGGRWSNGMVWNEYLAGMLGLETPSKSGNYVPGDTPAAGDTNFAHGGAMTSHGTTEAVIPSISQQINGRNFGLRENVGFDRYGVNFGSDDLVLIWGGANNLFFSGQTIILKDFEGAGIRAANEIVSSIEDLIAKGAKTVVALNLPDIGRTPAYADDTLGAENASLFTVSFNTQFAEGVERLKAENPDTAIIDVDVYAIFNDILMSPESFGIDDTSGQFISDYADYLESGDMSGFPVHLFYDDVHPTTDGHKLIAEAVYGAISAAVPEPSAYAAAFGIAALILAAWKRKK